MWIEVHHELPKHRKTLRLKTDLGVKTAQAVGHLVMLWLHCIEHAQDGDITDIPAEDLAMFAGYTGRKPEKFRDALIGAGFVDRTSDGRLLLHDWDEYAGKLNEKRRRDAERKRSVRRMSDGRPPDSPQDVPRSGARNLNHNLYPNQNLLPTYPVQEGKKEKERKEAGVGNHVENSGPDGIGLDEPLWVTPGHGRLIGGDGHGRT